MKAKYNFLALSLFLAFSAPALAHSTLEPATNSAQSNTALQDSRLTLEQIISIALQQDASREQLFAQSQATLSSGKAKATLMDPTVKFGFGGVPVDSFRLDLDPMSNISLGVMQKFDRGDTIELQTSQAEQQAQAVLQQAKAREHDVITAVTALWLELGYNQKAKSLLLQQEKWLTQLIDNQDSNYALGIGESQDVIAAQLKLSQLQQKLVNNSQMQLKLTAQLSEWLGNAWFEQSGALHASNQLDWHELQQTLASNTTSQLRYQLLMRHPVIQSLDSSLQSAQTQVSIAEEAYAPQFGVEVMYAHREANNMRGEPAPDMVSAYLTVDIPLYTGSKQDKSLEAAQYQVGAAKSQRDAWLARMGAQLTGLVSDKDHLQQRISHYQSQLLKQAKAQLAAVERGYQNNSASFGDIVTSSITQITIELELERLITDLNLTNNQIANLIGDYATGSINKASARRKIMKTIKVATVTLVVGTALGFAANQWLMPAHTMTSSPATSAASDEPLYWVAPMDPNYKRDKPGKSPMGMDLIPVYAEDLDGSVQEAGTVTISAAVENNLGVKTALVTKQPLQPIIDAVGYIAFDESALWQTNVRTSGWVEKLYVNAVGEKVSRDDVLFTFYSPDLVKAQEELLNAKRTGRKTLIQGAKERLSSLGVDQQQIEQIYRSGQAKQQVEIKAIADGVIASLNIREGGYLSPSQTVISAGPLGHVWSMLNYSNANLIGLKLVVKRR